MEERWIEGPGFACIFRMSAHLTLTLARGKKDKIPLEGKREFGWSWRSHLQDFLCQHYLAFF